jgi:hypothetical protein
MVLEEEGHCFYALKPHCHSSPGSNRGVFLCENPSMAATNTQATSHQAPNKGEAMRDHGRSKARIGKTLCAGIRNRRSKFGVRVCLGFV